MGKVTLTTIDKNIVKLASKWTKEQKAEAFEFWMQAYGDRYIEKWHKENKIASLLWTKRSKEKCRVYLEQRFYMWLRMRS